MSTESSFFEGGGGSLKKVSKKKTFQKQINTIIFLFS